MMIWLTIIGMALVTFLPRALPLLVPGEPPAWLQRWLQFVPAAVFVALIVPPLLLQTTAAGRALTFGPQIPAALVGTLVAWRTGNVVATIMAGLVVFWALRALGVA